MANAYRCTVSCAPSFSPLSSFSVNIAQ
ncbi:uncharacterized protein G2W53_043923 [Senna tora]|uniref:Uncharacterized protein n=1 Tax=Senna tora TaxID=362788 RepID=A0A834SPN8_9FABA|nr:uncharacterized protein G2W53_043923 [Senna tora]